MELIFRFSLLNVAHNSLDISNVSINIKFPLAACIVHITYFPKNRSLFPTLKSKPEGLVDATYYVKERLTRTIPSFNFFFLFTEEMNTTTVVNLQFSQLWKSRIHFTQKYIFIFIYTSFLL